MSYHKTTTISGHTATDEHKCLVMAGHWNIESAIKRGRKSMITGEMRIVHNIHDMSGKGRGGHDGRYKITENDEIIKKANWSEFGIEH